MDDYRVKKQVKKKKEKNTEDDFLFGLFRDIIISLIIIVILINFVAIPVRIDGTSMYPNLKDGDFGFSGIFTKALGLYRFDVVVIDSSKTEDRIVKRIIGLPGETVTYEDNQLYIDGVAMDETFISDDVYTEDLTVTLGEDEYFVLGDNRTVSRDSRYYGPFTSSEIIAKSILTLWPLSSFGFD